jgi:hypothetical protein
MPTVPSDEEFLTYNQGVINEFRAITALSVSRRSRSCS